MNSENPTFVSKPEHLGRIYVEKDTIAVRPATITTGQSDIPDVPGIAIVANGAARIILPVPEAWRLSDALADVLDSLEQASTTTGAQP